MQWGWSQAGSVLCADDDETLHLLLLPGLSSAKFTNASISKTHHIGWGVGYSNALAYPFRCALPTRICSEFAHWGVAPERDPVDCAFRLLTRPC